MRRQVLLDRLVGSIRVFSIAASLLLAALVGLCLWALDLSGWSGQLPFYLLGGLAALVGALFVVLRWGYRRLRAELIAAASEQASLLDSAHRDSLTGAFTRSHFFSRLKDTLYERTRPLVYMQIDMDNLKVLNDAHGHGAGDAALVHLVRTINTLLPDALVGRLGGDEFAVAFDGHENKAAIRRLGDQLLAELGQPLMMSGRPMRLSATIGIALAPVDADTAEELLTKADLALYKGKRSGRASTVLFDAGMVADERHKRFIERELRAAILMNELDVHYQPIFSEDRRTVRCYEALVRWQHTVRGRIMPSDFIPIAEQSDLIDKLGDWVLRRVCRDLGALGAPAININVSVVQLRRPDFVERFTAILRQTETAADRIVVEVTETVPLEAGTLELANLSALRELGVRIAVDDFGAGHASLENLRNFPFDTIKIDRSYISNLHRSRVDSLIVAAICKIARSLDVAVVAEGVETEEQMALLERSGCTGFQGYLLGRPAPLHDLVAAPGGRVATAA